MNYIIITDTHFTSACSTRVGDYLSQLLTKFEYVVKVTNSLDAQLLHAGDFFDKPTAPDLVKSRLIPLLQSLKRPLIVIPGNHDRLYNSDDYIERTSLYLLQEAHLLRILQPNEVITFDDSVVTTGRPLSINSPLPVLALNHGFLNCDDGLSSFYLQDILTSSNLLLILGHDHVPYDQVCYKNATILRPGSFARAIRNEAADRTPVMVHAYVNESKFHYKLLPIEVASPVQLLFKPKSTPKKSDLSYDNLINLIRSSVAEPSLEDSLKLVTTPEITSFILNKLD